MAYNISRHLLDNSPVIQLMAKREREKKNLSEEPNTAMTGLIFWGRRVHVASVLRMSQWSDFLDPFPQLLTHRHKLTVSKESAKTRPLPTHPCVSSDLKVKVTHVIPRLPSPAAPTWRMRRHALPVGRLCVSCISSAACVHISLLQNYFCLHISSGGHTFKAQQYIVKCKFWKRYCFQTLQEC